MKLQMIVLGIDYLLCAIMIISFEQKTQIIRIPLKCFSGRTKDIPDLEKKIAETQEAIEVLRKEKEEKDGALKVLENQMEAARAIQQVRGNGVRGVSFILKP